MTTKGRKWTTAQRAKFKATVASKATERKAPVTIFILLNGRLQRFVLRTMPVYVPQDDLKPRHADY